MAKQLKATEGGAPWCLKVELSEGCTRLCSFCGLNAIRSGPGGFKWMTVETAERIADSAAQFFPNVRLEFAGHGEPLSNPKAKEILAIFRKRLPTAQIMVTSAGDTIKTPTGEFHRMQEQVDALFAAGMTFLLLDTYYPEPNRSRLREEARSLTNVQIIDYYDDWYPEGISPYRKHPTSRVRRAIVLMDDLLARNRESGIRTMDSHAGCNPLQPGPAEPLKLTCGRPFREMVFNWNGDAILCCDDWKNQYVIGSIREESILSLWAHPKFEAARARLLAKDRGFGPCAKCDVPGAIRVGLLPDYDPPTDEQMALTRATSVSGTPLIYVGRRR